MNGAMPGSGTARPSAPLARHRCQRRPRRPGDQRKGLDPRPIREAGSAPGRSESGAGARRRPPAGSRAHLPRERQPGRRAEPDRRAGPEAHSKREHDRRPCRPGRPRRRPRRPIRAGRSFAGTISRLEPRPARRPRARRPHRILEQAERDPLSGAEALVAGPRAARGAGAAPDLGRRRLWPGRVRRRPDLRRLELLRLDGGPFRTTSTRAASEKSSTAAGSKETKSSGESGKIKN